MPKNVEVKAKIKNLNKVINIAENLCGSDAQILNQEDTFFRVSSGRLKLRTFQDGTKSQLIFYCRPDIKTAKLSNYSICHIENHQELFNVLNSALGVAGAVKKTRYLFFFEQTRIHIDQVEKLGDFIEFEVVLTPNQSIKEGEIIADYLIKKFEIDKEDLIEGAYVDLLQNNK